MDRLGLLSGFTIRAVLGVGLALFFSAMAVVAARLTYLFFGLTSWDAWFAMFLAGSGVGAAAGSLVNLVGAGPSGRMVFVTFVLLTVAAGIGGAWAGYSFGNGREVECCARPDMGPLAYSIVGATVVASAAAVLLGVVKCGSFKRPTPGRGSEYREVGTHLNPGLERNHSANLNA